MSSYDDVTVFSVDDGQILGIFCLSLVVLTSFDVLGMVRYITMPYSKFNKVLIVYVLKLRTYIYARLVLLH